MEIFSESYKRKYYVPTRSIGTIFCVLVWLIVFLVPFFLSFNQREFWKTVLIYNEQLNLDYSQYYLIIINTNSNNQLIHSNIREIYDSNELNVKSPIVKVVMEDINSDNKIDRIRGRLNFLGKSSEIKSIDLFLGMSATLEDNVKLEMQTILNLHIDGELGISNAYTMGEIEFHQETPFYLSNNYRSIYNSSVFSLNGYKSLNLFEMINTLMNRNESININQQNNVIPGIIGLQSENSLEEIEFSFLLFNRNQNIYYYEPMLGTLKFAWIKYLSLLIPLALIARWLINIAAKYKIFNVFEINEFDQFKKKKN